jgi:ribonuclease PH
MHQTNLALINAGIPVIDFVCAVTGGVTVHPMFATRTF